MMMISTFLVGFYPQIILVTIILLVIASAWIVSYQKKKGKNRLIREFNALASQNHLSIDKKQTLNRNMIGLDRRHLKLLFLNRSKTPHESHLISLEELSECELVNVKDKSDQYITSILLRCTFKTEDKPDLLLPFYDDKVDQLNRMMRLSKKASYWWKSINLFRESSVEEA